MQLFKNNPNNTFSDFQMFMLSLIISVVLLFWCSKNSLIYPMNDWTDVNIFFSVKDSMFHGNVLYKDIFEHKGPFLYLVIYSLAHFLGDNYFSIYLFECIANTLFVFFSIKTILLFEKQAPRIRIFLYAIFLELTLCTSNAFMFGGTVEELFLWTSSYGIYLTLRCLKQDHYYSNKELIWVGFLCGALFWTKFSLLGFYSGLALYAIYWNLSQKNVARLGKTVALFLGGFAISCIPEAIYCTMTQSFLDMLNVYLIENVFGNHWTNGSKYLLFVTVYKDFVLVSIILSGLFLIKKEQKKVKVFIVTSFITAMLASCFLEFFTTYYIIPMFAFITFGIVAFKEIKIKPLLKFFIAVVILTIHLFSSNMVTLYSPLIGDTPNPIFWHEYFFRLLKAAISLIILYIIYNYKGILKCRAALPIECVCFLVISALLSYLIREPIYFTDQPLPQERFAKSITQIENANIFVYKLYDHGFFRAAHTYPQVRYFCALNLAEENFETEQLGYIKKEVVDFIITFEDIQHDLHGTSYKLIDISEPYQYLGINCKYYLYQKEKHAHGD